MMVEGGAIEVPEEEIAEGLIAAHEGIKELCRIQREFMEGLRSPRWSGRRPRSTSAARTCSAS
jgi:polyribonucleotide nucleotidyltransferase